MITNKFKKIIAFIGVVTILVTCIYFVCGYYITKKQLINTQEEMLVVQNDLNDTTAKLANTQDELNRANETIASRDGDVYFIDCEVTEREIEMIAKTVWGEARGQDTIEQAAVIWCILNRVDAGGGSIAQVITAPNQFVGYIPSHPVTDELYALAKDVVARWKIEKLCYGSVGRVLPNDYRWFIGYDGDNHFRNQYSGNYNLWNWDCWNPY